LVFAAKANLSISCVINFRLHDEGIGQRAGFSYGTEDLKIVGGWMGVVAGVSRNVECKTWFFDGENVVDSL
jgi:hypothetical protein